MRNHARIAVVIPALNEADAIGRVIRDIPDWVDRVLVADNGSTDATAAVAQDAGATVVSEPHRGYGQACLTALAALAADPPAIVVFLDGDYSDFPAQMDRLVDPIAAGEQDLVIGSRVRGQAARGALTPQARFGNWLACRLIRSFWHVTFTDLGPFRAIRWDALQQLEMADPNYGWTVEMQVKAVQRSLRVTEVPVDYRPRIGKSKVSGTIRGVWGAGTKILGTIFQAAAQPAGAGPNRRVATRVCIFSRYPTPGETKTRLIPALGAEQAAALQTHLTRRTLAELKKLRRRDDFQLEVRFDGEDRKQMRALFGSDLAYEPQGPGDLGEKLTRAADDAFAAGLEQLVFVGVDCPALTSAHVMAAVWALGDADSAIGPAEDGGYYLLALKQPCPSAFEGITWGTDAVCNQTRERLAAAGLRVVALALLADVDRPEDLVAQGLGDWVKNR